MLGALGLFGVSAFAGAYETGLAHFEAGEIAASFDALSQVEPGGLEYLQAQLLIGVLYSKQGKLKSSVRAFRKVVEANDELELEPELWPLADELVGRAVLNIAGVYYSIQRFDEASTYVDLVPEGTDVWRDAQIVGAWADFLWNRIDQAHAHLDALDSQATPAAKRERLVRRGKHGRITWPDWAPEQHELRFLLAFNEGCFLQAEQALAGFDPYPALFETHFDLDAPPSELHGALAQEVLRDRELQALRAEGSPDADSRAAEVLDELEAMLARDLEAVQVNRFEVVHARSVGPDVCDPVQPVEQAGLLDRAIELGDALLAAEILREQEQGELMLRVAVDLEHRNADGDAERAQALMRRFLAEHPDHYLVDELSTVGAEPSGSP